MERTTHIIRKVHAGGENFGNLIVIEMQSIVCRNQRDKASIRVHVIDADEGLKEYHYCTTAAAYKYYYITSQSLHSSYSF